MPVINGLTDVFGINGLIENSVAAAAANAVTLQAENDSGAQSRKWFFRGGSSDTKPYYVDRTIKFTGVGRSFEGLGRHGWATGLADYSSLLLMSADHHSTTFNGTAYAATATSATYSVLTLTGRTVTAADKYNSVQITGGTNFTAGWYTITGVNTSANTWTLDRNCTNGSAASAMTGFYCPELIQNAGSGHSHVGLNFEGKLNNLATLSGRVGYHVLTGQQVTGSSDYPTGQHYFENCSWTNLDYALLCGAGMSKYGEQPTSFYGYHDDHADNITLNNCIFYNVVDAIVCRNYQSVIHNATALHAFLTGSLYRFDAGGKLFARGLEVSGTSGTQRLLTLGGAVDNNNGVYAISGFSFDGATRNPQLVVTEFDNVLSNTLATVVIEHGNLARGTTNDGLYLVDVQSCVAVTLRNIQGNAALGGIWPASIRLRKGPLETWIVPTPGNAPTLFVENCQLAVTSAQTEIIDNAHCDAGIKVVFRGCHNGRGTVYSDQVFTTG